MVLVLEVPLASIAVVLSAVSWKTLQTIKHLGVGKSFWIPVLCSGIFFFAGSIVAVLSDLGLSFTTYTAETIAVSRLLALCFLAGGVYTYSRKITMNLAEKLTPPAEATEEEPDKEVEASAPITALLDKKRPETEVNCKHQLGYLRTLPRHASIPEECAGCPQIIECKYSVVKKAQENSAACPLQEPSGS
jgi:hypothetical protein